MFTVAHLSRAKTLLNKRVKTIKRRINMKYTVWVGGTEVTDYLVDRDTADEILMDYLDKGYDEKDVWIDEVVTQIDRAKEDVR
jgi:hypothetical protein